MQKAVNFILTANVTYPFSFIPACILGHTTSLTPIIIISLTAEKLKNWKRMWFEIIYCIAHGSDWFWNSN